MENITLSFIIPALNEEKNLPKTIASIRSAVKKTMYEILVIDNGSIDDTVNIAQSLGALTFENSNATIAELRNLGVKYSSGDFICFIDSDISIENNWEKELIKFLNSRANDQLFITGSRCEVDFRNITFVQKNWFNLLKNSKSKYINSGHLITTRNTFNKIGGFDPTLKTGEDYDFCQRASTLEIPIIENKKLKAIHEGYPKTIWQFFLREAWHGRSDSSSIRNFIKSKIAIVSLVNAIALSVLFLGLISGQIALATLGLTSALLIIFIITIYKFGAMPLNQFLKVAFCFEIYMLGRLYALHYKRKRPAARE